jgi:phage shock protein E
MFGMFNQDPQIECPEARHMVQNHGAQLVDVRSPMEHAQGSLPGAVNLPHNMVHVGHEKLDRSKPVIVYCASGARSAHAKSALESLGFSNVHNLGSVHKYLSC